MLPSKTLSNVSVIALHLQTVANAQTTSREQGSTPRPPELNKNPSLRTRENTYMLQIDEVHEHHHG